MTRGQVAAFLSINPETIRYYENINLIEPGIDPRNGYRYYDEILVSRLELILRFKTLGFSLKEIGAFFELLQNSLEKPERLGKYIEQKIRDIDEQIANLTSVKRQLLQFKNREDRKTCDLFAKFI
ncbi:MAG: MerR family transcriptional regulator [Spirochaetales bacterium]|nr:MerR family transcriptional regulator [Spirochaetales bacterium]